MSDAGILYKDIPITGVIPHSATHKTVSIILHIQTMIAWSVDLIIIVAILREKLRDIPRDTQFILSLCCADFVFASVVMTFGFIDLFAGGWGELFSVLSVNSLRLTPIIIGTGKIGCLSIAGLIVFSVAVSIYSLCGLTLYRYLIVAHKIFLNNNHVVIAIVSIWLVLFGVITGFIFTPGFADNAVALQSSHLYCGLTWWGVDDPIIAIAVSIALISVAFPIAFISYAYTSIVTLYMRSKKAKILAELGSAIPAGVVVDFGISPQELLLIKKALFISGSYLICWMPLLIKIVIEIVTKYPVPYAFDVICAFFACYNTIFNAAILVFFDAKVISKSVLP